MPDAVSLFEWVILAGWLALEPDEGKTPHYQQHMEREGKSDGMEERREEDLGPPRNIRANSWANRYTQVGAAAAAERGDLTIVITIQPISVYIERANSV